MPGYELESIAMEALGNTSDTNIWAANEETDTSFADFSVDQDDIIDGM